MMTNQKSASTTKSPEIPMSIIENAGSQGEPTGRATCEEWTVLIIASVPHTKCRAPTDPTAQGPIKYR